MGKDPAFLFYPNDYIGGTMGMTFEEKGAYMDVLMMQFNRGHMTEHMENENRNRIINREKIFKSEVKKFNSPHENEFIEYWTEPNKSGTKMRFEMEKTWDLKRRLSRWGSNNFGKKETSRPKLKNTKNVERILNVNYDDPKFKSNRP